MTGLLAIVSTVLLVLQAVEWVVAHRSQVRPNAGGSTAQQGQTARPTVEINEPGNRSNASIPPPATVQVHPLGESAPANDGTQNWSAPLSFSLSSDSRVDVSESALDVRFRMITKRGADPSINVDVNGNGKFDKNLDYKLLVIGLRPNLSSSMETIHGEDSYARKVYHRHATIYNEYAISGGGFTYTAFDPDIDEFKWVVPKSELSLDGASARLTFHLGSGKPQLEKTIYFGVPVATETISEFRQKYMSEPASQMQGP